MEKHETQTMNRGACIRGKAQEKASKGQLTRGSRPIGGKNKRKSPSSRDRVHHLKKKKKDRGRRKPCSRMAALTVVYEKKTKKKKKKKNLAATQPRKRGHVVFPASRRRVLAFPKNASPSPERGSMKGGLVQKKKKMKGHIVGVGPKNREGVCCKGRKKGEEKKPQKKRRLGRRFVNPLGESRKWRRLPRGSPFGGTVKKKEKCFQP